jgi:tetratricopeptide (TPR) repeat protein
MLLGRHREAADDLTAVLGRFPEDAELYEHRAACYTAMGDRARAAVDREAAAKWLWGSADRLNTRAWKLLTGPPQERDAKQALELARKAVAVSGDEGQYLNTLGIALYRNGRWTEAIAALENSLAQGKGKSDAWDLFFLAMCHARLGDRTKARDCFDQAVKWVEGHKDLPGEHREEVKAFRTEAEEVLRNAPPSK